MAFYDSTSLTSYLGIPLWLLVIVLIWSVIWKGFALWKSARKNHMIWFVAILLINTVGILEILYIFLFSKIELDKKSKKKTRKKVTRKTRRR